MQLLVLGQSRCDCRPSQRIWMRPDPIHRRLKCPPLLRNPMFHKLLTLIVKSMVPRFLELSRENREMLIRAHKNLGHPSNEKLSLILRQQGFPSEITSGILDMRCSVCHMHARPKHSRPGTVKEELDFNDRIAIDGLTFTNSQGQVFHLYHVIDLATSFHVATIAPSRTAESAIQAIIQMWLCWAGPPCEIIMDSATEFVSETFSDFLQSHNIRSTTVPPEGHWQNGRCERRHLRGNPP